MVKQQHQTLKAVTVDKLLTVNIPRQHLSLLEIQNFQRKPANQAVDVSLGTNVVFFQMASRKIAIAPENLEISHFF